jgi:uncharacterized iron-regulated membrane protein
MATLYSPVSPAAVPANAGIGRARLLVRRVHLWLGLTLGLLFAVIGATGSALVFYTAIDAALHPVVGSEGVARLAHRDPQAPALAAPWTPAQGRGDGVHDDTSTIRRPGEGRGPATEQGWRAERQLPTASQLGPGLRRGTATLLLGERLERAFATGSARFHRPGGKWSFEVTGEEDAIPARYYPAAMPGHHADRLMVWFSPDGGRIVRVARWGGYLMSWIYQLHMELLAGELGLQIVGWSGVAMLVLLVSGVVAWWPRGSWRKALAFKRDAAPIRRLRDLHKLSGVWSALLLLVLVATGVLLALPSVTQALLAPGTPVVPVSAAVPAGGRPVGIGQALAAAQRALPDGRLVFVDVPIGGTAPIRARYQVPGDPHARFPASYVYLDQVSGRVLGVHDARRGGAGAQVNLWVRTLHDGTVGGMATRVLAVIVGLMPGVLFVTGVLHWLRRRRQARRCSTL